MWPSQLKWVGLLLCHFLGMANFPKGVSWHWFWVFNRISLSNLFYTRKYTSYTYKKFISDISKCLKQATHEKGVGEVSKTAQIQISFSWFSFPPCVIALDFPPDLPKVLSSSGNTVNLPAVGHSSSGSRVGEGEPHPESWLKDTDKKHKNYRLLNDYAVWHTNY